MDADDEDFIFYGTPIEREEELTSRKRKAAAEAAGNLRSLPTWKQEVFSHSITLFYSDENFARKILNPGIQNPKQSKEVQLLFTFFYPLHSLLGADAELQ